MRVAPFRTLPVLVLMLTTALPVAAETECYGEGDYRVCVNSYVDSNGDVHSTSTDSMGNSYSVDSETYVSPSGDITSRSYDSEGNSYEVRSYTDAFGSHSVDSEGNSCTITNAGVMIGCD